MFFRQINDTCLAQYAYLIGCETTGEAIVIDPERDVDRYLSIADEEDLRIVAAAETHIHADFLSGVRELADCAGVKVYVSAEGEGEGWSSKWAERSSYDVILLRDGGRFQVGNLTLQAVHTPGHTPEHVSFVVTDAEAEEPMGIVTGDFLFVGDLGRPDLLETAAKIQNTARASAKRLFTSAHRAFKFSDYLQVWPAHGAGSACGKSLGAVPQSTIGYEKAQNPGLAKAREGETAFVEYILKDQPEPPLYFARMKELNRDGVPLLGALPRPRQLSVQELRKAVRHAKATILDTRPDRAVFMRKHLPGALHAPLNAGFCMAVGSLVEESTANLLLIASPQHLDEVIRRLVRIGYDNVEMTSSVDTLYRYFSTGGEAQTIATITFREAEELRRSGAPVVDVRNPSEFEHGHLPGAILAPYSRLPEHLVRLPKGVKLLVHCGSGQRAAVASSYLARKGYDVTLIDDLFSSYPKVGTVERGRAEAA